MVDTTVLQPHEYWLTDVARMMHMPIATVHTWQRMGWVHSRTVAVAAGRWTIGLMTTNWSASGGYGPTNASGLNRGTRPP